MDPQYNPLAEVDPSLMPAAFPVGSVFLSVVSTNPTAMLGYGVWEQISQGRFLVGQKSTDAQFDTPEETGGAKTHTHSAHANHVVTQPSNHTVTNPNNHNTINGQILGGPSVIVIEPSHAGTNVSAHTGTDVDAHSAHNSPQHLPPFFVVYMWKRTA